MRFQKYLRIVLLGFVAYTTTSMGSWQTAKSTNPFLWKGTEGYAMSQLAVPYIKDAALREQASRVLFCGTPTIQYLLEHPMPSEETLIEHAAVLEARLIAQQ
jgi:hypothetical protein